MIFITSNSAKFSQAQRRLSHAGISLTQFYMELPESQPATGFQVASVHSIVDPVAISCAVRTYTLEKKSYKTLHGAKNLIVSYSDDFSAFMNKN